MMREWERFSFPDATEAHEDGRRDLRIESRVRREWRRDPGSPSRWATRMRERYWSPVGNGYERG